MSDVNVTLHDDVFSSGSAYFRRVLHTSLNHNDHDIVLDIAPKVADWGRFPPIQEDLIENGWQQNITFRRSDAVAVHKCYDGRGDHSWIWIDLKSSVYPYNILVFTTGWTDFKGRLERISNEIWSN